MSSQIQFILNDELIVTDLPAGMLVLDYLRRHRRAVGTKEGCKEGDCGACMVLVGESDANGVSYKPVTSCLMPVGELHGKHLVTIEGLNRESLTPIQQAIVDEGGSQCGFCTPGIVVSLTGHLLDASRELSVDGLKNTLGGNLCRCTGYASLLRACEIFLHKFSNAIASKLNRIEKLIAAEFLPEYFSAIPEKLAEISQARFQKSGERPDFIIAGGTDIYVQKGPAISGADVDVLNLQHEFKGIGVIDSEVRVGALTTFEEFASNSDIRKCIPQIETYNFYNASWQIRNRATLGGNIVNASPIGDMTALLLAMDSDLVLTSGKTQRIVPLKSFFLGYKKLILQRNEIVNEIRFPVPPSDVLINFEKVSKRKTLDIASVNSSIKVVASDGIITQISLAMGGVAPIPLFMQQTCDFLQGKSISAETVLAANEVAQNEISPISDIRGSADYKRLLVRQFLIAHFTRLFPEILTVSAFYETC